MAEVITVKVASGDEAVHLRLITGQGATFSPAVARELATQLLLCAARTERRLERVKPE